MRNIFDCAEQFFKLEAAMRGFGAVFQMRGGNCDAPRRKTCVGDFRKQSRASAAPDFAQSFLQKNLLREFSFAFFKQTRSFFFRCYTNRKADV